MQRSNVLWCTLSLNIQDWYIFGLFPLKQKQKPTKLNLKWVWSHLVPFKNGFSYFHLAFIFQIKGSCNFACALVTVFCIGFLYWQITEIFVLAVLLKLYKTTFSFYCKLFYEFLRNVSNKTRLYCPINFGFCQSLDQLSMETDLEVEDFEVEI